MTPYRRLFHTLALAALAAAAVSCSGKKAREVTFADDRDLGEQAETVDTCYTADTVFVFGADSVRSLEIARIFPTEHDDVYLSLIHI